MALFVRLSLVGAFLPFLCLGQNENICEDSNRKCSHVAALVPARAGSKGIKDKNLSLIGNETLLARSLRIINECGNFDSVWVSTDGKAIADEAVAHNAKVHWRSPETGTDNASTVSVVVDFLLKNKEPHYVAVVQCTSPFIQNKFLCEALEQLRKSNADCLFSVTRSHQLRWTQDKDFVTPLNFDLKNRPRRQDWAGELLENGMFYFVKKDLVLQDKLLQNNRCKTYEVPKRFSMEIDTKFDLILARALEKIIFKDLNE